MAELKTKKNAASVSAFLRAIADADKQRDARAIVKMMTRATGERPAMWGTSIVGFGSYHYRYDSGHEGDSALVGFSPRANSFTLYLAAGFEKLDAVLDRLGKHTKGKGCLYIKRLADVDEAALEELVKKGHA